MLRVIFTLDYEIHGNGDGCPSELMVKPTSRMMDLFDEFEAKLTIMADVAEILKFCEYKEQFRRDDYHYDDIVAQLQNAVKRGHDVQLHLHPSYFNAKHDGEKWCQDWSEYNLAALSRERVVEHIGMGKKYLQELLRPIDPAYRCIAFRAANWSMSPSRNIVWALANNGFEIDSSVFKYGRRTGQVNFDYTTACSHVVPWPVNEDDICRRADGGRIVEVPIYSELRRIGCFLTANRIYRAAWGRLHRVPGSDASAPGNGGAKSSEGALPQRLWSLLAGRHAWKTDFNQCSGRQLISAVKRAYDDHGEAKRDLPFVLMGHSKLFNRMNKSSLKSFLEFVARRRERFSFSRLQDLDVSVFR